MPLLSPDTRQTISDSLNLFVLCLCVLIFASILAIVERCEVAYGIAGHVILVTEYLVNLLVYADALVFTFIVARVVLRAWRDLKDEYFKKP